MAFRLELARQLHPGRSRHYLAGDHSAVLGVISTRRGWRLVNHFTADPGTGAGARLRALVLPGLIEEADELGIQIELVAHDAPVGELYRRDLPGLEHVKGARYRRAPRPPEEHRTAT